ncbi:MAG: VRR-NUC domain-containing protein [Candidatus Methanomethylicaceae archaeon]
MRLSQKNRIKERDILRQIREFLALLGPRCYVIRQHQSLGSTRGVPDLTGCIYHPHGGSRFFAIEVKGPRGRVTPAQAKHLEAIKQAGGICVVARSVDDVLAAFREAGVPLPIAD